MQGECITYPLGRKLDLKRLAGIDYLRQEDPAIPMLSGSAGGMRILLFEDGRMRVFIPGMGIEKLKARLASSGFEVYSVVEDVRKALGLDVSARDVMAGGKQETVDGTQLARRLGGDVPLAVLRRLAYSAYDVIGEFSAERVATQAGESHGRELGRGVASKEELLQKLAAHLEENKIGRMELAKPAAGKAASPEAVALVYESAFSYGIPFINRPVCNFLRGLFRGAFASFYSSENVSVHETKCWGLGDLHCEFEIYLFSR